MSSAAVVIDALRIKLASDMGGVLSCDMEKSAKP